MTLENIATNVVTDSRGERTKKYSPLTPVNYKVLGLAMIYFISTINAELMSVDKTAGIQGYLRNSRSVTSCPEPKPDYKTAITDIAQSFFSIFMSSSWAVVEEYDDFEYNSFSISSDGGTLAFINEDIVDFSPSTNAEPIDLTEYDIGKFIPYTLSGDGSTLVVGDDSYNGENRRIGQVLVFSKSESDSTEWQLDKRFYGVPEFDELGSSVSISDDGMRVAIGGGGHSKNDRFTNFVHVYENVNGVWTILTAHSPDVPVSRASTFDSIVQISGDGSMMIFGFDQIYIFDLESNPDQQSQAIPYPYKNIDLPRFSISRDGSTFAVADGVCSKHKLEVYRRVGTDFAIVDNIETSDRFPSISLSSDGSMLAYGKPDVAISGKVYVWSVKNDSIRFMQIIDGFGMRDVFTLTSPRFGKKVSFLNDGNKIAVASRQKMIIFEQ